MQPRQAIEPGYSLGYCVPTHVEAIQPIDPSVGPWDYRVLTGDHGPLWWLRWLTMSPAYRQALYYDLVARELAQGAECHVRRGIQYHYCSYHLALGLGLHGEPGPIGSSASGAVTGG